MKPARHLLQGLLVAASLLLTGAPHAQQTAPSANTVKMDSLRGGVELSKEVPVTGARQQRDTGVKDRDFVQQPPLVPHTIEGYQITKNFNKCMDCHAWQRAKEAGATKVSVTHFRTREGQELDNISPRRYFCTQCRVPQTDAKPLVDNTFQRARGLR